MAGATGQKTSNGPIRRFWPVVIALAFSCLAPQGVKTWLFRTSDPNVQIACWSSGVSGGEANPGGQDTMHERRIFCSRNSKCCVLYRESAPSVGAVLCNRSRSLPRVSGSAWSPANGLTPRLSSVRKSALIDRDVLGLCCHLLIPRCRRSPAWPEKNPATDALASDDQSRPTHALCLDGGVSVAGSCSNSLANGSPPVASFEFGPGHPQPRLGATGFGIANRPGADQSDV